MDLLLYLIRKRNLDILDIPIAILTTQYMAYVDKIKTIKLELAVEYEDASTLVKNIVPEGYKKVLKLARETMRDLRDVIGLNYS